MSENNGKLLPVPLGLTVGILWGLGVLITGLIAAWHGSWGVDFVTAVGSVYVGYENTVMGSLIGGFWGLIDGFIGGVVFAWLYNKFASCKKCCPFSGCSSNKDAEK